MQIDEAAGKVSIQSCPAGTSVLKGYLLAVFGFNTYEFENDVYAYNTTVPTPDYPNITIQTITQKDPRATSNKVPCPYGYSTMEPISMPTTMQLVIQPVHQHYN